MKNLFYKKIKYANVTMYMSHYKSEPNHVT